MMRLSPLNQRRWRNFKRNRRAVWSLIIFGVLFGLSLFAELIANDKPILVSYQGEWRMPIVSFYSERDFGGDFPTQARYQDVEVQCLIKTGGMEDCFDDPDGLIAAVDAGADSEGSPSPSSMTTGAEFRSINFITSSNVKSNSDF